MIGSTSRVVIAASVGFVCACGADDDRAAVHSALIGRSFVSESVEGWQLVPGTAVGISFSEQELHASAGCNLIDAEYVIQGTTLQLGGYGMTEVGCDPARHAQDDWLVQVLRARPTLALSEPRLTMSTAGTRLVLIDREVAIPDRPLVGTSWIGEALGDGSVVMGGPGVDQMTVSFDDTGSVEVHTGCQLGVGTFQVEGTTISFEGLTYDGAPCAQPGSQFVSDRVLLVLNGAPVTFAIDELSLELSQGTNSLYFRAAE